MKQKRLLAGAAVMALTLSTAIGVYATQTSENKLTFQHEDQEFVSNGGSLNFNETELPEGVEYREAISMGNIGAAGQE